ncbi:hypothetical protein BS78_05G000500 [Paspalum vaginatum]|nr:hypothetical protein BS78_05G000500 [Paspalum vaginatum]
MSNRLAMAVPCCSSYHSQDEEAAAAAELLLTTTAGRWRSSLASGLRAALACTIVGLASLYAPPALRRHITFPAFSYVVTVIIVTDATLGTALRGAVSALHATLMGAAPSVVALWLAHRTGAAESVLATSAVVALTAFAVALPESVGPVAKRIALGQTIIVYVAMFRRGDHPSRAFALLHPANVVACTALGVAAALLAVLLPWPRLATREARDKGRAYKLLAAERVRVLCDAFIISTTGTETETETEVYCCSRQRRWQMAACMSEANRLASASTAALNRINAIKEDLQWEQRGVVVDDNKITSMGMAMAGMQIALATIMAQADDDQSGGGEYGSTVGGLVMAMRDHIRLALLTPPSITTKHQRQHRRFGSSSSMPTTTLLPPPPPFGLFLFSLHQLHQLCCGGPSSKAATACAVAIGNANTKVAPASQESSEGDQQDGVVDYGEDPAQAEAAAGTADAGRAHIIQDKQEANKPKQQQGPCLVHWPPRRRLVAAAKCGFSLGLAVLLGLIFSNDHGFWSGLIVATTMNAGRESTWAVAVARAHGTALGSVYGALCCLLISRQQRLLDMDLRFLLAILPWMVLATFLKRSRAYGPSGGVAAALSVVIIVGRRYDEPPMAFTMARLVETFIGISCAVLADLVFQPGARPSVQAREQLTRCIAALADDDGGAYVELKLKRLQLALLRLRKHVAEAGSEPTYLWLPPFPAACYDKIQGSLSRMAQLLELYHQALLVMSCSSSSSQQADTTDDSEDDDEGDMMMQRARAQARFGSLVSTSLRHCLRMLQGGCQQQQQAVVDLEAATGTGGDAGSRCCCGKVGQEEATAPEQVVLGSFLNKVGLLEEEDNGGTTGVLSLSCLGTIALCMAEIVKEAQRLEAHILDLNSLQPSAVAWSLSAR